jgi:hypothetical protein
LYVTKYHFLHIYFKLEHQYIRAKTLPNILNTLCVSDRNIGGIYENISDCIVVNVLGKSSKCCSHDKVALTSIHCHRLC